VGLSALESLNLSESNWENARTLFAAELPSLKTLDLSNCESLKTEDIDHVGLSALESLGLAYSNLKKSELVNLFKSREKQPRIKSPYYMNQEKQQLQLRILRTK